MILEQLATSSRVFIDANILIYALLPDPTHGVRCNQFLERIGSGDLQAATSSHALTNVAHRLMTVEACETFGWQYAGIARQMKRHADKVKQLSKYRSSLGGIVGLGVEVWPVYAADIERSADVSAAHGLLNNDALIVGMMQDRGVAFLASADSDFDRIPGLTRAGL